MNYCDPQGFKNEIKNNIDRGKEAFFTWFDGGDTVDGSFEKAEGIFKRLMLPWAERFYTTTRFDMSNKTSLDIGYGGGGQVLAASKHFKYALGVDVHEEIEFVESELKRRTKGKEGNIALFTGDGKTLPIDDNKVDFVSSWLTFLHLGTMEIVEGYLKEMYRVMIEEAIAVLFFTRLVRGKNIQTLVEYENDLKLENEHPLGYREGGPLTRVNRPNIVISRWKMEELVKKNNFKLLNTTFSHDGDLIYGQHGIVIQKPKVHKSSQTKSSSEVNKDKPKVRLKIQSKKGKD